MISQDGPNPSFEESLQELERIARDLEDGMLGLEEALARYEKGVRLIQQCQGKLQQAEQRILLVTNPEPSGEFSTQPFEFEATAKPGNSPKVRVGRETR